ncbi:PREDICTED: fasciclin-like arabinogalactan protein 4 [Nelumbo nucifera]|nr:PREDICTED: fasciclin-like arabinogalactan protein 4 [Nelumbo nucifera]
MAKFTISHFSLSILSYLFLSPSSLIVALDITTLLSAYPDLSDFNNLLTTTSVAQDLTDRSSLTLLAVPNHFLSSSSDLTRRSSPANLADVIRYHVLLQYLSWPDFRQIPPSGKLVTTLYQTTGRATNNFGAVNITRNPLDGTVYIRSPVAYSPLNATILSLIKTLPYNVSIFSINTLLVPYGFNLMASENRPPPGLNITRVLIDGHNFNVAASMLTASGVAEEFEADEGGAGITMFIPTDDAFADLSTTERLQSLPAERKAVVLKFHVLHSYYPLGSLESIVNPVQPTLATEAMGAGTFTLNITRVNGSVAIDTGIVQASITQTVFDQNPVSIFAVSRVLLPREIFGKQILGSTRYGSANARVGSPPPEISFSPENSPGLESPSTHPGFSQEFRSSVAVTGVRSTVVVVAVALSCIPLYLV